MPPDLSERRTATEAIRTPPVNAVAENECTPAATMDAKGADAQKLIAAGERMPEVVKRLRSLHYDEVVLLGSDVHLRHGLYLQIRSIITFAETGE